MATARDVAQYILLKRGRMTAWKLQKLVYYAQAWALVWDEKPLFTERVEAWANGPVVPDLYQQHKGKFEITRISGGDPTALTDDERETIDAVLETYGGKSSQYLRDLTHNEPPWLDARNRAGVGEGERGSAVIPIGAMSDYYGKL